MKLKLKNIFNCEGTNHFIIWLTICTILLRLFSVFFVIIYPDSKNINDILGLNIDDSLWYLKIARYGYLPPFNLPDYIPGEFVMIAFAPLFPAILSCAVMLFQDYASFVVNSCFIALTPFFIVKFLRNIIHDENTIRKTAVIIMFSPVFWGYSLLGLSEPLSYLLMFMVLTVHYKKGKIYRISEYTLLAGLVLSHFTFIVFSTFYLFKAIFTRAISLKKRISIAFPAMIVILTFIAWNIVCKILFGHIPSDAELQYWGNGLNLNIFSPGFLMQLPILAIGIFMALAVLNSTISKNEQKIAHESKQFARIEIQALLIFASAMIVFLGVMSFNESLFRLTCILFPIYMIVFMQFETSKYLRGLMLYYYWGLIAGYTIVIFITSSVFNNATYKILMHGDPNILVHISFYLADSILMVSFGIIYLALSLKLMRSWYKTINLSKLILLQIICAILIIPLVLPFP